MCVYHQTCFIGTSAKETSEKKTTLPSARTKTDRSDTFRLFSMQPFYKHSVKITNHISSKISMFKWIFVAN